MPPTVYYMAPSRSTRVRWAFEELGVPYELRTITREQRAREPGLSPHPLGRVPVIVDDGEILFESAAIVLAIADRHPDGGLNFPLASRERELVYQWVLFALTEVEPPVGEWREMREQDPERARAAAARFAAAAGVLERALDGHDHLVADRFSAADIIVGAVLDFARRVGLPDDSPTLSRYLAALDARPARVAADAPAMPASAGPDLPGEHPTSR